MFKRNNSRLAALRAAATSSLDRPVPHDLFCQCKRCIGRRSAPSGKRLLTETAARAGAAALVVGALTACTGTDAVGGIGDAKALIEACTKAVDTYVALDGTTSGKSSTLDESRKDATTLTLSRDTAACGGEATVVAFSSSAAATATLWSGRIPLTGATDTSKARRLEKAVNAVVDTITVQYNEIAPTLDPGTDVVAQLKLAAEWFAQKPGDHTRKVLVLTDGFENQQATLDQIVADPEAAAQHLPVPDLTDAEVTFAGIGKVSGTAPSTHVVESLKHFYAALCKKTGAQCQVVSEIAGGGAK